MIIKRIEPASAAKVAAFINGAIGLIGGILVALGGMLSGGLLGTSFGVAAIVLFPVVNAVVGYIVTFIAVIVYNFAAGKVGGIQLDVE